MEINYLAVIVGAILAMLVGWIWYGPIFGKKWMQIIGADALDEDDRKEMQKNAIILFIIQFFLSLLQVYVFAVLVAYIASDQAIQLGLWIWAAFIIPTLASAIMWTNEPHSYKWMRFLIQAGYQLIMFIIYAILLQYWK